MPKPIKKKIRIQIVDRDPMARLGVRTLIGKRPKMEVVGEAGNGPEALEAAARERPNIILLDLALSEESGLDFLGDLLVAAAEARIVILTGVRDREAHQRAVQLGAMGLVFKDKAEEVLTKAIEKVHNGEVWLDRSLMASVLSERSREERPQTQDLNASRIRSLTARELQVVELVCQGLKNRQIADKLFISDATVRNHLTSILSKLGLSNRFELALYAYRQHLATPPR